MVQEPPMANLNASMINLGESSTLTSDVSLVLSYPLSSMPINPNFSMKLDEANYLIWKEHIKHIVV